MTRAALKYLAFGIGFCPFDWCWGDLSAQIGSGRMFAVGPLRLAWRWRMGGAS